MMRRPPGGVELLALRRITPATRFGSSRPDYLLRVGMYFPVAGAPRRRAAARSYDDRINACVALSPIAVPTVALVLACIVI